MRSFVLLLLLALPACDALRDADPAATAATETTDTNASDGVVHPHPLHSVEASCLPKTTALLDDATRALAAHDAVKGEALVRDAEPSYRAESLSSKCLSEVGERVRVRRLALRHTAMRTAHADDLEVLLDLGGESFDTSLCKEALVATCEDALAWFQVRYPNFVEGTSIAIRSMDRLPITPQPGGRLTVEYMNTLDNRLHEVSGDVFAMTISPTVRIDSPSAAELRVDGADVIEESDDCVRVSASQSARSSSASWPTAAPVNGSGDGSVCAKERKTGAHVSIFVPASDLTRVNAQSNPVVVVVKKSDFHHGAGSWRASGRVAYVTR